MKNFKDHFAFSFTALLIILISLWVIFNNGRWEKLEVIRWDSSGYYMYLPATIIYKDLKRAEFYDTFLDKSYFPASDCKNYGLTLHENGNKTNKYPIGVALLEMPFFLVAHTISINLSPDQANGYSKYYQLAIQIGALLYFLLSYVLLYKILIIYVRKNSAVLGLAVIFFGTNTFYYTLFESGMSHIYSFFLFSLIIYSSIRIFIRREISWVNYFLLSLGIYLSLITRPIDILIVIFPLYLFCYQFKLSDNYKTDLIRFVGSLVICFPIILLQLYYWKITSGHWIYYSYTHETFNFLDSQIINGLFSYKKGWFLYTPLALIMVIALMFQIYLKRLLEFSVPILLFISIYTYIIFSWHSWYYGGGFGCRPMIQVYSLLAIPLILSIDWVYNQNRKIKLASFFLILSLVALNLFQTYQYKKGIIHYDSMTKELYWNNFLRIK